MARSSSSLGLPVLLAAVALAGLGPSACGGSGSAPAPTRVDSIDDDDATKGATKGPATAPPSVKTRAPDAPAYDGPPLDDDPLRRARETIGQRANPEAPIPPACYTRTRTESGALANPCWVCHGSSSRPDRQPDRQRQASYAFSDAGKVNRWTNLFEDRRAAVEAIDDATMLAWVREDNYTPLREFMAAVEDDPTRGSYRGYRPDLDFVAGFDERGWAVDGSGWRAFRFKPFPGSSWPTHGSTHDAALRLPERYRQTEAGEASQAIYAINLAILEASMASDPGLADEALRWPTEPLDETVAGVDLDGDGFLEKAITELAGLPERYVGGAHRHRVRRGIYPEGTEFIQSIRYLDPDAPGMVAARMKELRYSYKKRELSDSRILAARSQRTEGTAEGTLPAYGGGPLNGVSTGLGWVLQAFIEDDQGRLRVQTEEEHLACVGCHAGLGVPADQSYSLPRKLPGAAGWAYQSLAGMPDAPQVGMQRGEVAVYLERALAGDALRADREMIARWLVDGGALDEAALADAEDLAALVTPSRERALLLDKAYLVLVREQSFTRGRDPVIEPVETVHRRLDGEASTGLSEGERVYTDGRLQLAWPGLPSPSTSLGAPP